MVRDYICSKTERGLGQLDVIDAIMALTFLEHIFDLSGDKFIAEDIGRFVVFDNASDKRILHVREVYIDENKLQFAGLAKSHPKYSLEGLKKDLEKIDSFNKTVNSYLTVNIETQEEIKMLTAKALELDGFKIPRSQYAVELDEDIIALKEVDIMKVSKESKGKDSIDIKTNFGLTVEMRLIDNN